MGQLVITVMAALVTFGYGAVALMLPHKIQEWWIGQRLRKSVAMKIYGKSLESERYIIYLRVTGAVSMAVSILLGHSAFSLFSFLRG